MKMTTKSIARAAIIAAIYVLLTMLLQPLSFGAVQFRIAEALTLLPILMIDSIPGLFIGCLLANLFGGAPWYDIVFGSLATLLAACITYSLRKKPLLAAAAPVVCNGLIVGPVVYFAYVEGTGIWALLGTMGSVAFGELVVCYVLGLILIKALRRVPESVLID